MSKPDFTRHLLTMATAAILFGGLTTADAQQAAAPAIPPAQRAQPVISESITVDEAVGIALKNSPTVEARQAMVAAAAARIGMAKAMTRPQVAGTGYATAASTAMIVPGPEVVGGPRTWTMAPDTGRLDGMVMGMYPLYTGGKLQAQINNAQSLRNAATGDLAASELNAALAAKTAYYQVLLARELVDVYQQRVTEAQERLRIAEEALKEGRIARYDLLRNQTDLAESRQQLNNAKRDVEVALADLKNALGVSQESSVTLTSSLSVPELLEQLADLQQLAVQQRPEVAAAQSRIQAAQANVAVAKSAYKPQVYATGMAEIMASAGDSDGGALIGVTAALPILDGGLRKSAVNEAQAMVGQAEAERRDVLLAVNRDVSASYARAEAAAKNVDLAKAAVDQAEEDYRIIKLRYEAGKAINVEVLDALASLTRARADYVAALYNYNVARADLLRATGRR